MLAALEGVARACFTERADGDFATREAVAALPWDPRSDRLVLSEQFRAGAIEAPEGPWLIEAVADRLWLVDGGSVRPFEGDLADYERLVLERARMMRKRARAEKSACEGRRWQAARETEAAKKHQAAPGARRPNAGRLRRELARLEEEMAALEEKIGVFDAALDGGRLYAEDAEQAARFAAARTRLAEELTRLEERWLALSATLEELEAARSQS